MQGSSGSPLLAWLSDYPRAFGLHRGGMAEKTNEAHTFAAAMREFVGLGVPLDERRSH